MATRRTVEAKLRELIARLAGADDARTSLAASLPEPRVLAIYLPDLDAEYWTVMASGSMDSLHRGAPDHADIRVRMSSDHLVDLVDGHRSLMASVMSGQVKLQASLGDILRLRKMA